jgi:glycosyltransferase involved in cell wall biosynthesis
VVSEEDRRALLEVAPGLSIEVIPNGVDADAFAWDGTPRDRSLILFTGVMSYAPNVTAAEFLAHEVLPRVRSSVPAARLALVGRDPHPSVRTIEAEVPGVEVVGEVPEMRPWLSRAGAYACPMLTGTGIKNKLLEAMANGLPCVATPLALRGIAVSPGHDLLTGSTAEELATQLVRVLQDPALADRVGEAGHDCVRARHTWASVAQRYEQVYREIVPGS